MIWPWSTIERLKRELSEARTKRDLWMDQVVKDRRLRNALRAENESLRAQLAAKIGMESAYNPDNQPPGVSDAARRPVFPTPPKVSRPKRVWK